MRARAAPVIRAHARGCGFRSGTRPHRRMRHGRAAHHVLWVLALCCIGVLLVWHLREMRQFERNRWNSKRQGVLRELGEELNALAVAPEGPLAPTAPNRELGDVLASEEAAKWDADCGCTVARAFRGTPIMPRDLVLLVESYSPAQGWVNLLFGDGSVLRIPDGRLAEVLAADDRRREELGLQPIASR